MNKCVFVFLLGLFLIACSPPDNPNVNQVSPMESAGLQSNDFAVIIDVRTDGEWKSERIPGAIHIPLDELDKRMHELKTFEGKQLIMQCAVGGRSSEAVEILQQAGFNNVSNMNGGIVAWNKANLPLE
ncbi:rhodanese-like domain-containing protein [Pseudomonadota bacterium]|nr:rhodanese-like domain-containing protein [Pseudomonadota bacterium]